nr:hypothetical protein [Jiangella rhizosphaerae]
MRFLDGAVKDVPDGVGRPDSLLYFAGDLVPYSVRWLRMIGEVLPAFAAGMDARDYGAGASSVNLFLAGADWDLEFAREAGLDDAWLRPLHDLVRKAAAAGHGEGSIAALTEVLGTG